MSNDSEDSVRKEDLISNLDQEFNVGDYVSHLELKEDPFLPIDQQIGFLTNKYNSIKEILNDDKTIGKIDTTLLRDEEIVKNPKLLKEIILENMHYRNKISSIESNNNTLLGEINSLQKQSSEKDYEINALKEEINHIRLEKSDSIYQVKSILKDFDIFSKYASSNHSNKYNPLNNSHGLNRESMSSVGTNSTTNSNNQQIQIEFDKLQKEKVGLENQLVMYKFKYAEQSSKIIELEDEREMFKKKYEASSEKMRIKEEIIKSLIQERDSLRVPSLNTKRINHHKIPNAPLSHRGSNNFHGQINRSPERSETQSNHPIHLETEIISNDFINTSNINSSHLHTEYNAPSGSKTPGGFVKIFKNIFSSDKK